MQSGSVAASRLTGNVYRGTDDKRPVRPFVVIQDSGEESVLVENVDAPHVTRSIKRRRLGTYHYELIGRRADNGQAIERWAPPPVFDGPGFARWLRKWMEAEGIQNTDLAERAGISVGVVQVLRRGTPQSYVSRKGQSALHPGIETIAAVAHGLGLQFSYVASKAGFGDEGDRWVNFSEAERTALFIALDGETDGDDLDLLLDRAIAPTSKEAVS